MKKRILIFFLATALVIGTDASGALAKTVSQEELEELKKELQKEIDEYDLEEDNDDFFSVFSFSNSKSSVSGSVTVDASYAEPMMDMAMECVEEAAAYPDPNSFAFNTEEYDYLAPNGFSKVAVNPLSTFAADVDTGSYCNLRRMVNDGYSADQIPSGSIRTEELLNYFDYTVTEQSDGKFSLQYETAQCPWNEENELLLMTVQANETDLESKGNRFVYLIDTSGSMDYAEKIALAKCSFKLLSYTLDEEDLVSIVTYSGDSYTALEACPGNDYEKICETLDEIVPYGGTNGSGGIEAAYEIAENYFLEGGNNRVIIASDGDMNLGITSESGLVDLITKEKESGVYLTVLGFGSGNYSDANMESIADAGNGNYFYIDCLDEAQRVLIEKQKEVTLTVAKDVKFQAEFNPALVSEYRLLGYENRNVADSDFQNDAVDGGEVGAGAQVTVLYELKKAQEEETKEQTLKYQKNPELSEASATGELLTLSINYKDPDEDSSRTESYAVKRTEGETSSDMNLAMGIAELSMILRQDPLGETLKLDEALELAKQAEGGVFDRMGYTMMLEKLAENSRY